MLNLARKELLVRIDDANGEGHRVIVLQRTETFLVRVSVEMNDISLLGLEGRLSVQFRRYTLRQQ